MYIIHTIYCKHTYYIYTYYTHAVLVYILFFVRLNCRFSRGSALRCVPHTLTIRSPFQSSPLQRHVGAKKERQWRFPAGAIPGCIKLVYFGIFGRRNTQCPDAFGLMMMMMMMMIPFFEPIPKAWINATWGHWPVSLSLKKRTDRSVLKRAEGFGRVGGRW